MHAVARQGLVAWLAILAWPGLAAAGYAESFAAGMKALDKKHWLLAARSMQEAIDQQPRETGERVRVYGMRFERYLPYYYLGFAHYRMGDCARALPAFDRSRQAKAVGGVLRGRLNLYTDVCTRRLGSVGGGGGGGGGASGALGSPAPPPASRPGFTGSPGSGARPAAPGTASTQPTGRPAPSGSGPSPAPGAGPPSAPAPGAIPSTPSSPAAVRRQVLTKIVGETEEALRAGDALRRRIEDRRRSDPGAFARAPGAADEFAAAGRQLESARFRLEACRLEGDLDGAEQARDDARGAVEVLREVAAAVGVA